MKKIAIDVVLLPSKDITDLAINLNKRLINFSSNKIVLNRTNCVPHISLCMGVIDDKNLKNASLALGEAIEEHPILP